jgi:hypothetical protein
VEPAHGLRGPHAGTDAARERAPVQSPLSGRASTVEGSPAGQVDESSSSPELLVNGKGEKTGMAAAFSDEVGGTVAGVVLRRGGKEEGAHAQVYPEKKVARGVLGAPLTVE